MKCRHYKAWIALAIGFASLAQPAFELQSGTATSSPEAIETTVQSAIADLRSADSEIRRGSVMLLAKYPQHPLALRAVAAVLGDDEATVRRAAAVSLAENIQMLDSGLSRLLLLALQDSDPEVRLTVSTWLPQLLMNSQQRILSLGTRIQGMDTKDDETESLLLHATRDSNPLVRLNVVDALRYLPQIQPGRFLPHLLVDSDARVRTMTWQAMAARLNVQQLAQAAALVLETEDSASVRMAIVELLASRVHPSLIESLQRLSNDANPVIRGQAIISLFIASAGESLPADVLDAINFDSTPSPLLFQLIQYLRSLPTDKSRAALQQLMQAKVPAVRALAVVAWMQSFNDWPSTDLLLAALQDSSPEVRSQAIAHLRMRIQSPPPAELLSAMVEIRHEEVRAAVIHLLQLASPDTRNLTILRLLMDESASIRHAALLQVVVHRPPNWQRLMRGSLRDSHPQIQQTAAQALVRQLGTEGRDVARQFIREFPNAAISQSMQSQLPRNP